MYAYKLIYNLFIYLLYDFIQISYKLQYTQSKCSPKMSKCKQCCLYYSVPCAIVTVYFASTCLSQLNVNLAATRNSERQTDKDCEISIAISL